MSEFIDLLLPWWWGEINWITDSFISVILMAFIILSAIFLWKTILRGRLVDSLNKEVGKYSRPAQPSAKHNLKVQFEHNQLAEAWLEFEDSLITRPRDENREVVYKTDDASLFFDEGRLLDQHLNLRFWNSVPALLVGFGILGTFFGLVWGLIPFGGIDFNETAGLRTAIQKLLAGVSTAFVTSVWGMFTSLLFNVLEKWHIGRVSRAIGNLQRALNQLFTLTTQEEISLRQEDEIAQQTAALKSVSTDFAIAIGEQLRPSFGTLESVVDRIQSAIEHGQTQILEKIDNAPKAFGAAISEQLKPSLDKLNETVEQLREQKEESSTDAIRELVEEFQELLAGSVITQMNTLAEGLGKLSEGLMELPEQMKTMIASVQDQINQTRQLLDAISKEQTNQMEEMLKKMLKAFEEAHINAADTQSNTIAQAMQTLQAVIEQLREALDSTASQTSEEFKSMTQRMRELVDHSATRLDKIFRSGEESVSTLLRQQGEQIKAINAQLSSSHETLAKGRDMLEQMNTSVTNVHQMIETAPGFVRSVDDGRRAA